MRVKYRGRRIMRLLVLHAYEYYYQTLNYLSLEMALYGFSTHILWEVYITSSSFVLLLYFLDAVRRQNEIVRHLCIPDSLLARHLSFPLQKFH